MSGLKSKSENPPRHAASQLFGRGKRQKLEQEDPGLGRQYRLKPKRVINQDGSFNIKRRGMGYSTHNVYQWLITLPWSYFLLVVFAFIVALNLVFATIYYLEGTHEFNGITPGTELHKFIQLFYFSIQTFSTVGYGHISPASDLAGLISSIESIIGLMSFSLSTGLLYGRFSKPSARLIFSKKVLITPYKDVQSLQFRIVNSRMSTLMEMNAKVMLTMVDKQRGHFQRSYYELKLERNYVLFFPLNWTIVHPIDEDSPLYGMSRQEIEAANAELLILIKGFDDTFSQTVHQRGSYTCEEFVWGAKFKSAYHTHEETGDVIMEMDNFHDYHNVAMETKVLTHLKVHKEAKSASGK